MKSLEFFKPTLATTLAIGSWRLVLLLATAVSLIGYPKPASAATVNVAVGVSRPLMRPDRFRSFVGNDPPWRSGEVGLAYERPQHHVRSPGDAQRHMGFWSS